MLTTVLGDRAFPYSPLPLIVEKIIDGNVSLISVVYFFIDLHYPLF